MLKHQEKIVFFKCIDVLFFDRAQFDTINSDTINYKTKKEKKQKVLLLYMNLFVLIFDLHIVKLRSAVIFSCAFFSLQFVHNKRRKLC